VFGVVLIIITIIYIVAVTSVSIPIVVIAFVKALRNLLLYKCRQHVRLRGSTGGEMSNNLDMERVHGKPRYV